MPNYSSNNTNRKLGRLGSINDAAERLGVGAQSVRRMIARGEITGYRVPGLRTIRVDLDELDAKLRPIPTVGPDAA